MCGLLSALFFNTFRSSGLLSQASYARLRPQMRCESLIASPRKYSTSTSSRRCWWGLHGSEFECQGVKR